MRGVIRILVKACKLVHVKAGSRKIQLHLSVEDDSVKSKRMGCHYFAKRKSKGGCEGGL